MIRILTKERHISKIKKFLDEHELENEIYTSNDRIPNTPFDLGVSYIWTKKITEPLLSKPSKGWINYHPAPLPKYGGWKYIEKAIENKEMNWGVTVHFMDETYDTGPIIKILPIELHEPPTVFHELASVSYHFLFLLFKQTILDIWNQKLPLKDDEYSKNIEMKKDPTGFLSVKNLPSEMELSKFYQKQYFQDDKTRPKSYQITYTEKELKHIDLLNNLLFHSLYSSRPEWKDNKPSFLEVGIGEGFTLSKAHSIGWNVKGIDFGDYGLKQFNRHMINYFEKGKIREILESYISKNLTFDVCVIKNVLEHTRDPRSLLELLKKILKKNGIISITIPNDYSNIQLKAIELEHVKNEFWLQPPQHLHYFNSKNIKTFLQSINFQIIDMYSSFPIDFFLFHHDSNYILDETKGKFAHFARVELETMLADENLTTYHNLCQSMASCGIGRNLTVLATLNK